MRLHAFVLPVLAAAPLFADTGVAHRHQMRPPNKVELAAEEVVLPFEMVDGRPVVPVTLEGQGPFAFIFDTGAGGMLLDAALATELELSVQGQARIGSPMGGEPIPASVVWIDRTQLGGATILEAHAIAGDLTKRLGSSIGPGRIFSPRMLPGLLVTIDFPRGVVVLRKGALPAADGVTIFEHAPGDPLPGVPVTLGDVKVTAHIDTGNRGGFDLPKELMEKLPLAAPAIESGRMKTVDAERVTMSAKLKGTLGFGGQSAADPEVRFVERGIANIGTAVLKDFVVTLDPANRRVRLERPRS